MKVSSGSSSQIIEASSRSRQTLCFSATMPADLKRMLDSGAVRSEYERVDATGAAGSVDQTASRVDLRRVALPKGADALGALANVLKKHREGRAGSKVVVFLPTTAAAELASAYLANRGLSNALHSRKSQGYRTRTSNEFRDADAREHALLVATDVAARGVDYPGVSSGGPGRHARQPRAVRPPLGANGPRGHRRRSRYYSWRTGSSRWRRTCSATSRASST